MEDKKDKNVKKRVFFLVAAAVLLVVNLIFYSLGWFTSNKQTSTNGMGMQSVDSPYELIVSGNDISNAEKKLFTSLVLDNKNYQNGKVRGNSDERITDNDHLSIFWLSNDFFDYSASEEENWGIEPGTSGELKFKILPKESGNHKIKLNISAIACNDFVDEDENEFIGVIDKEKASPVEEAALGYIDDHIFFFKHKTGDQYSELIEDGELTISLNNAIAGVPSEEYSIFWIWPNTLRQILSNSSDPAIEKNIFDDESQNIIISKIKAAMLASSTEGSSIHSIAGQLPDIDSDSLSVLSIAYNEEDQQIGLNVRYLLFELTLNS